MLSLRRRAQLPEQHYRVDDETEGDSRRDSACTDVCPVVRLRTLALAASNGNVCSPRLRERSSSLGSTHAEIQGEWLRRTRASSRMASEPVGTRSPKVWHTSVRASISQLSIRLCTRRNSSLQNGSKVVLGKTRA